MGTRERGMKMFIEELVNELSHYPKTETFSTGIDMVICTKSIDEHRKVISEMKDRYGDNDLCIRVYPNTESIVHEGYIRSRLQWPNTDGESGTIKREC